MLTMWGPGYYLAAHRLRMVIDYNRLIVLDKMEVTKFDTSLNLIQKEDGILGPCVSRAGRMRSWRVRRGPRWSAFVAWGVIIILLVK